MLLFAAMLLAGVMAGAPPIVKDNGKTGLDAERLARIPARMKSFVDAGKGPGIVTLVARNGHVAAVDAVGYFDAESKKAMPADAIFQIHSMTKPVVCLAVMMLMEEGKLALTDAVEKHLPEFRGQMLMEGGALRKPARPATIRDLMTHTSGMMLNPPPGIEELHGALHKSLKDVVLILSQQPLLFEPGSRWSYSNTGIAALARIIEVHSGMAFEKYLEARIFHPLGMSDTYIYPPKEKFHRMPTAYILKDGKPVKYTMDPLGEGAMKFRENARYPLPEGGIYSTATDLFHLYQLMLNKGVLNGVRLLSPASVEVMTAVHTGDLRTNGPGNGWGLGWYVVKDPQGELNLMSRGTFGHGGRYGTFCFVDPKRNMIGIFMIHREGGSEERIAFTEMAYAAMTQ
ncbi:MAG: serine hydrolase domain-containing protein [Bryobacteraceae bacterium]|nr:serine hydrolase domain-containing protein [Bryobacteraceae bacterium]